MSNPKGNKGKVRFIRKGGRVIPIRAKSAGKSDAIKYESRKRIAAGVAGAGFVGSQASAYATVKMMKDVSPDISLFRPTEYKHYGVLKGLKKHKKLIREAGPFKFVRPGHGGAMGMVLPGPAADFANKQVHIGMKSNQAALLHEFGHLKASKRKYSFNWLTRKAAETIYDRKAGIGKKAVAGTWAVARRLGLDVLEEAEATTEALKSIKRVEGTKAALKSLKFYAPAYGSYAGKAMMFGGIGAAAYYAIKESRATSGK